MIRFRNPGTDYNTHISVLKVLYKDLCKYETFDLNDIAEVLANSNLMTAYGYAGDNALKLSEAKINDSLNSAKMNAKMYAEVFRLLGWVTPALPNKSYPLKFTLISAHLANTSNQEVCKKLYEKCVLGIVYPSELYKTSFNEKSRIFTSILKFFLELDGIMYKHELNLGPMSCDDDEDSIRRQINYLKNVRGDYGKLTSEFEKLCDSLGMKNDPVDNCTRLPIALLKACDFVDTIKNKDIYNKSLTCLQITEHGKRVASILDEYYDLRLNEFLSFNKDIQLSAIRLGLFNMLDEAGFDLSPMKAIYLNDSDKCQVFTKGKKLMFSPYQTIRHELIDEALANFKASDDRLKKDFVNISKSNDDRENAVSSEKSFKSILTLTEKRSIKNSDTTSLETEISSLYASLNSIDNVIKHLKIKYSKSNKDIFYPLIGEAFTIIGVNCHISRSGDNGSRWDAIIIDQNNSIPIEIKSPGEEINVSIKAVRQALENKIILLSRKTYVTTVKCSSFVVGYEYPNKRAEVESLIKFIRETYGMRIAVFDLETLLKICALICIKHYSVKFDDLIRLEGFVDENIKD